MKKGVKRGFTFLELLFSVLVFSIGMLAYISYQGRLSAMLFETESSIMATSIASEITEEINAMRDEDFLALIVTGASDPDKGEWISDADLKGYSPLLHFTAGPFDEFGRPLIDGATPMFYRLVRIRKYDQFVNIDHDENTPSDVLRVIEVSVGWPRKDSSSLVCDQMPMPNGCNEIRVLVIRPIFG